jgi:cobalt/nickel transport system permease protein
MSHFDIDKYADLKSPLHNFDPRAKLICLFILMISIVLLNNLIILIFGLIISVAIVLISRLPLLFIFKRLKWVAIFIFAVLVILPFSVGKTELFSVYFLSIYREGLRLAIIIALKAFSVILLMFPMLATMRFVTFIKALEQLRLPNKLVQIITFTYRYIFIILNELKHTIISIETRSYQKSTWRLKLRALGSAIGMILIRSYERGERIFQAMRARGYSGRIETLDKFEMHGSDWAKAGSLLTIAIVIHVISYTSIVYIPMV